MACGFFISARKTDQSWHMPRQIRVHAGSYATVHFVMKLLQSLNMLIREYSLTSHVIQT